MAKIVFEKDKCIGCGSCEAVCPKYWKLLPEGKAEFLGSQEVAEVGCNQQAVDSCPVQCIHIEK